jgi:hypothetical protein
MPSIRTLALARLAVLAAVLAVCGGALRTLTLARLAVVAGVLAVCGGAHAGDSVSEWRVLGPAFSYHLSTEGAQYAGTPSWNCQANHITAARDENGRIIEATAKFTPFGQPVKITDTGGFPAIPKALGVTPVGNGVLTATGNGSMFYQAWGQRDYTPTTYAADSVLCSTSGHGDERRWHQSNPAIGLERSWREDGHVDKVYGTLVRDSYGRPSLMAGAGRLWEIGAVGTVQLDAGFVGGLWLRSNLNDDNTLRHQLVPFAIPAMSLTESASGLGMNVAFAPKLTINGRVLNSVSVVMFQMTYLIAQTTQTKKTVSVASTPAGGVMASLGINY